MIYLGPSQAAARLGICNATLTRWANTGKLAHIRINGRNRLYDEKVIDRLVRERAEAAAV